MGRETERRPGRGRIPLLVQRPTGPGAPAGPAPGCGPGSGRSAGPRPPRPRPTRLRPGRGRRAPPWAGPAPGPASASRASRWARKAGKPHPPRAFIASRDSTSVVPSQMLSTWASRSSTGRPGVLHVAGAAEALQQLAAAGHRLPGGGELHQGGDQPLQRRVAGGRTPPGPGLRPRGRPGGRRPGLRPPGPRGCPVQRLSGKRRAEGDALAGVVPGQHEPAAQQAGGADRVPGAGDVEHGRHGAHAVGEVADRHGHHAVQVQLGGGQLAGAQLVLEAVDR